MKHPVIGRLLVPLFPLACLCYAPSLSRGEDSGASSATTPAYAGRPYAGKIAAIPGTIQAEAYDAAPGGAKGVTFNYNGQTKQSPWRTTPDSIGLANFGRGHVTTSGQPEAPGQVYAGWTHVGEWWKYTVKVAAKGTYRIGGHFASGSKNSRLLFSFAPQSSSEPAVATEALLIPTTAGFQPGVEVYHVWETLDDIGEVTLPPGVYILTVEIKNEAGLNLDYFTFTPKP